MLCIYITSNTEILVRWGCLCMVEDNIVSYWSCSKFWRTVSKYILAFLYKAKFQVVYHTLTLLFWRPSFQVFLSCCPMEGWVLGCVSHALQLLSVLFWVFWIQLIREDTCVFVYLCVSFTRCVYLYIEGRLVVNIQILSIQIHTPRKTDAEIDEYARIFTY